MAVVVGVTLAARGGGPEPDHDHDTGPDIPAGVVRESPETHPDPDAAAIAAAAGVSTDEAKTALAFQDAFGAYADDIRDRFPDQVAAVYMDSPTGSELSTHGYIRFTGDVPGGIEPMANVTLSGGAEISSESHARRARLAAQALEDLGYLSYVTGYDPVADVLDIRVKLPEGTAEVSKSAVVDAMSQIVGASGLSGRAARVELADVKVTITRGTGAYIKNEHSRGGNWVLNGSVRTCTSGFSVNGPDGDGIVTAAHCDGLTKFEEPGVTPYDMTHRREVYGDDGDAEYHTTVHEERAEFYRNSSTIRDVEDTKSTGSMVGAYACRYGRASDNAVCNHRVTRVLINTHDPGCDCTVGNMAEATNASSQNGDSGGPMYRAYTAWGIHKGQADGYTYFMPIDEVEDELDVTVKTQ